MQTTMRLCKQPCQAYNGFVVACVGISSIRHSRNGDRQLSPPRVPGPDSPASHDPLPTPAWFHSARWVSHLTHFGHRTYPGTPGACRTVDPVPSAAWRSSCGSPLHLIFPHYHSALFSLLPVRPMSMSKVENEHSFFRTIRVER